MEVRYVISIRSGGRWSPLVFSLVCVKYVNVCESYVIPWRGNINALNSEMEHACMSLVHHVEQLAKSCSPLHVGYGEWDNRFVSSAV